MSTSLTLCLQPVGRVAVTRSVTGRAQPRAGVRRKSEEGPVAQTLGADTSGALPRSGGEVRSHRLASRAACHSRGFPSRPTSSPPTAGPVDPDSIVPA